ncbi:hypothetical protein [Novosphingobium album (ex Liu et al. 2023)]|uniref:DUF2336 domain-containing protein n=1 Tax=Novosphingobium album (ex Liu et al. 2023) TaxID=3031130 RepID=A0ABT5WWD7_9SPHN|nr:hypothetical protein [Novosphingobium album (ex Liu et al. 2023)]MDE8654182.1 hypothetical protein [Novosphingobium album (ex Liu et al. 2023)]
MIERAVPPAQPDSVEAVLREELARGDAMAETVLPILRHLIANKDNSVFSDEILARVRGMIGAIAAELLDARLAASGDGEGPARDPAALQALFDALIDNPALLSHTHALALEWQLTERLQARLALDPVVPPLLQALVASPEPGTQEMAMRLLAAQSRFCQNQRRMMLPLCELPGDLLHAALVAARAQAGPAADADERVALAESRLRARYDEGASRLGLISQLVLGMGGGMIAALSVTHAGVAIFLSAMAIGSGQGRDAAILATHDAQWARLALALRSAGLKPAGVAEQILALHPQASLPDEFASLSAERAATILAAGPFREPQG